MHVRIGTAGSISEDIKETFALNKSLKYENEELRLGRVRGRERVERWCRRQRRGVYRRQQMHNDT